MKRLLYRMAVPAAIALTLAACGGGDYYDNTAPIATTPPPTTTPTPTPTPTASAYDTFVAYMQRTVASLLDTSEPADITAFDPAPVSDVLEPVATQ